MNESSGGSILVVDDDPDIRQDIAAILELEDYPVQTAGNGLAALRVIDQAPPALILLDMHLPFLDGRELVANLEKRGLDIPVILMTGDPNAVELAREVGAAGVLAKPFDLSDLLGTVERACQGRRHWWDRLVRH